METARVFPRSRRTWTGWRRGPAGPAALPHRGQGRCACPKSGGRPWPPSSSTIRPSGIWRDLDGRIGVLLQGRDGLRADRIRLDALLGERESCSKPWAGRPAPGSPELDQQLDELEHQRREVGEAISAGRHGRKRPVRRAGQPGQRRGLGTWDMLGADCLPPWPSTGTWTMPRRVSAGPSSACPASALSWPTCGTWSFPRCRSRGVRHLADYFFDGFSWTGWYSPKKDRTPSGGRRGCPGSCPRCCSTRLRNLERMDQELAGRAGRSGERALPQRKLLLTRVDGFRPREGAVDKPPAKAEGRIV